ncbi:MAG TPA: hypothetical protein VG497_06430 [Kribbella sp.]|nr:hypothetical protein [Kribbella sp.]
MNIRAPQPISAADRAFIANVEKSLRPAFVHAIAEEFRPADRPVTEIAELMAAAAPGERLQTVIEARMKSSGHFDALPAEEWSAAAQQAALAAARSLDGKLTVEASDSRLGQLAGKGADRLLRGQYESLAHTAGSQAGLVLGGAINRVRFVHMEQAQRQATAGVTPPGTRPQTASATTSATNSAAARPADRSRDNRHEPHGRG